MSEHRDATSLTTTPQVQPLQVHGNANEHPARPEKNEKEKPSPDPPLFRSNRRQERGQSEERRGRSPKPRQTNTPDSRTGSLNRSSQQRPKQTPAQTKPKTAKKTPRVPDENKGRAQTEKHKMQQVPPLQRDRSHRENKRDPLKAGGKGPRNHGPPPNNGPAPPDRSPPDRPWRRGPKPTSPDPREEDPEGFFELHSTLAETPITYDEALKLTRVLDVSQPTTISSCYRIFSEWHHFTDSQKQNIFNLVWIKMIREWTFKGTEEQRKIYQKYQLRSKSEKSCTSTMHATARAARNVAENMVYAFIISEANQRNLTTQRIVDYFGKDHTGNKTVLHDEVAKRDPTFVPNLTCTHHSPVLTPKDAVYAADRGVVDFEPTDIIYMCDIYMEDPISLLTDLAQLPCEKFYLVTMIFHADVTAGIRFEDMPFHKRGDQVIQAPDLGSTAWPTTKSNDLWQRTNYMEVDGVHFCWDIWRTVLDYYCIVIRKVDEKPVFDAPIQEPPFSPNDMITIKTIKPYTWQAKLKHAAISFLKLDRLPSFRTIYDRPLQVFIPALRDLSGHMAYKTRQAYQVSTLTASVQSLMLKHDKVWRLPEVSFADVLADTVAYLTWSKIEREHETWDCSVKQLGQIALSIKMMKNKFIPSSGSWDCGAKYIAMILAGGVIAGLYGYHKLRNIFSPVHLAASSFFPIIRSALDNAGTDNLKMLQAAQNVINEPTIAPFIKTWRDLTTAPLIEEPAKLVFPLFVPIIGTLEGLASFAVPIPLWAKISMLVVKNAVHWWFTKTSSPIATHSAWNAGVMAGMFSLVPGHPLRWALVYATCLQSALFGCYTRNPLCIPESAFAFAGGWALHNGLVSLAAAASVPWYAKVALSAAGIVWLGTRYGVQRTEETNFTPSETKCALTRPGYELSKFQTDFVAKIPKDLYDAVPVTAGYYHLLLPPRPFQRPHGLYQFVHAYFRRCLQPVPISDTCEQSWFPEKYPKPTQDDCLFTYGRFSDKTECEVKDKWKHATQLALQFFTRKFSHVEIKLKRPDWAAHFGSAQKKHRALDAIGKIGDNDVLYKTEIFLKADEVLWDRPNSKGRVVKAVSPTVQAVAAPHVDIAITNLKNICDGKTVYGFGKWKVTIAIGSGKTSTELNDWFLIAENHVRYIQNSIHFIVAGDDFFGMVNIDSRVFYLESDYSQYDRTQGVHALESCMVVENALGIPLHILGQMYSAALAVARYENKVSGFHIACPMPAQRATGGPDTTLGNSVNNITACLYTLHKTPPHRLIEDFVDVLLELGFVAKLKYSEDHTRHTFLKGWWVSGCWLPLPSQVLKIGKILTSPVEIYPHLVKEKAWRQAARAVALGFGSVPLDYPILGPFIQRYLSLYDGEAIIEQDANKIKVDALVEIDRAEAICQISERYNLDNAAIEEMEYEIRNIPFPGQLTHPGFTLLAKVDYG